MHSIKYFTNSLIDETLRKNSGLIKFQNKHQNNNLKKLIFPSFGSMCDRSINVKQAQR